MGKADQGVRILLVPFGDEPREMYIEDDYREYQRVIGGRSFTEVFVGPGVAIVAADDHHGIEGQANGCGLYGTYFFYGVGRNLTDKQVEKCRKYWEARRHESPPSVGEFERPMTVLSGPSLEAHRSRLAKDRQVQTDYWRSL